MAVERWAQPIGGIGENELCKLLFFGTEQFFTFAEYHVDRLGGTSIKAQPTGFHTS